MHWLRMNVGVGCAGHMLHFYLDQLCINPPYNTEARGDEAKREGDRVTLWSTLAYMGAKFGIIGTPLGGAG